MGGSYGTLLGMVAFQRKWKRPLFRMGIPVLVVAHTAVLFVLMKAL